MDKLIHINENNHTRKNTSENDINSIKLTAPIVNLLPYDTYSSYATPLYLDGAYINDYGSYHFDFSNGLTYNSGRQLLDIKNVQNIVDFKPGKYTICFRVKNITGTYNIGGIPCYRRYYNVSLGTATSQNIGTITINPLTSNGALYNLVFNVEEDQLSYELSLGCDFLSWTTASRDVSFDFEFIGLFQGELSVERPSNTFSEKPSVTIENSDNILGEYQINTDIQRHLAQMERHITAQNNQFIIKFR